MLNSYNLAVNITAIKHIDSNEFRIKVAESLSHLDHLKRAIDNSPLLYYFYPVIDDDGNEKQSVLAIVHISVGKKRGQALLELYQSMVRLIKFELPNFDVSYNIELDKP